MNDKINEILEKNGYTYQEYNYWRKNIRINGIYWGCVCIQKLMNKKYKVYISELLIKSECDIEIVKELFVEANQLVNQINEMVGEEK